MRIIKKNDEIPGMRIIEKMAIYKPADGSITEENIRAFVEDYIEGKLKQHFLSYPLLAKHFLWYIVAKITESYEFLDLFAVAWKSARKLVVEFRSLVEKFVYKSNKQLQ